MFPARAEQYFPWGATSPEAAEIMIYPGTTAFSVQPRGNGNAGARCGRLVRVLFGVLLAAALMVLLVRSDTAEGAVERAVAAHGAGLQAT